MVEVRAFEGARLLGSLPLHSGKTYTIGREADNDLQLNSPGLSRRHLQLKWEGNNDFFVTDPGSSNGTWFMDSRLPAKREVRMEIGSELMLAGPKGIRLEVRALEGVKPAKKETTGPKIEAPKGGPTAELTLFQSGKATQTFTLVPGQTQYIGRTGFGADIEINSPSVSRRHARIRLRKNQVLELADAGSSNGTFVNAQQITALSLTQGDTLTFGGTPGIEMKVTKLASREAGSTPLSPSIDQIPNLSQLLEKHHRITLGRDSGNLVRLPHPTASRIHAEIIRQGPNQFLIRDLNSRNGTRINGQLLKGQTQITRTDIISIGPYEFTLGTAQENLLSERIKSDAAIIAKGLVTKVDNGRKTILHNVSLKINEGEMIAIMGPSGCGKSTLMNALNGYFPASQGTVRIMGIDLNKQNYPYLKQFIGFVPQDDIVHRNLTVAQSLRFAAKLKLPDASEKEIKIRIQEVCQSLKISNQDVEGIQDRRVSDLSGGQRKRVSIAVELLTQPRILFLDEPTSPLDPQTIDEFLDCLRGLTQPRNGEPGTTVVLVTHKPGDLEDMDKVIFMAAGGYLAYYGPVDTFKDYFKVKKVNEVYQQLSNKQSGPALLKKWQQTPSGRAAEALPASSSKGKAYKGKRESGLRQAWWLTRRYFKIKTNDRINTFLLLIQAPVIALLTLTIFNSLTWGVFFMMSISAIWFGTNNAAREVVGEWAIYVRERMFNLKILPYLASKMIVLTLLSCIQAVVFVLIIWLGFSHPERSGQLMQEPGLAMAGMMLICFVSSLIGLLISVAVDNTEKVMTLVPLVVIPQILLSGMLAPISEGGAVDFASHVTVSRWSMELLVDAEGEIWEFVPQVGLGPGYYEEEIGYEAEYDEPEEIWYEDREERYVLKGPDEIRGFPPYRGAGVDLAFLLGWGAFYFLMIVVLLKRKDRI